MALVRWGAIPGGQSLGGNRLGKSLGEIPWGEPAGESDLVRRYGVIAAMPVSSSLPPERIVAWV